MGIKNQDELERLSFYVLAGMGPKKLLLSKKQLSRLEEYALQIKDLELYDMLQEYWKEFKKIS